MTKEGTAKPFLRWAGDKSRLLPEIRKQYPKTIKRYVEPFIGGGAVLFDILSSRCPEEVCINDANKELAHIYSTVRDYPEELIRRLGKLEEEFLRLDTDRRKEYYTIRRSRFNELIRVPVLYAGHEMLMEKASLMVFLNRTCFNGLWRVNKNGGFNVPVGSYKKPVICDGGNIRRVSLALQGVSITGTSYEEMEHVIGKDTFIYLDPPYRPITRTSFTSYHTEAFDDESQIHLREFAGRMAEKGAMVLISNSDPKNTDPEDDFFDTLYYGWNIRRVRIPRLIGAKKESGGGKLRSCSFQIFKPVAICPLF